MEQDKIRIRGARENNLKNIDLDIPRNKMVILTGVSGSGKTSLAFDTIYAEGQRRYIESLSAYARQFLGGVDKPDVESIEGLSPAISIDQKTTSNNPRSTVGTVTEIYDYLRLLYARVGVPYCPHHHIPITAQTIKQMVTKVFENEEGTKITVMSPVVKRKKGTQKDLFAKLLKDGYVRAMVDGTIVRIEEAPELEKNKNHDISVVIDRLVLKKENESRLYDSLETACKLSDGLAEVDADGTLQLFSENYSCPHCGFTVPRLEPRLFSFNSPLGACPDCHGLGFKERIDIGLLIPDPSKTIREGGIKYYRWIVDSDNIEWQQFSTLLRHYRISEDKPLEKMTEREMDIVLHGSKEPITYEIESRSGLRTRKTGFIEGAADLIERRYFETSSAMAKDWYGGYMAEDECPTCRGRRLNEAVLSVEVGGKNIYEFTEMSILSALSFIDHLQLPGEKAVIAEMVLKEIRDRLRFLKDVGLEYLTLNRMAGTLSGGEAQRIRLATQIGSHLTGVLYVLDEPSIGLHQRDNGRLIRTMQNMRDLGNTVIVVEHDEETMMSSDWIVDIGPGAGIHGGEVIYNGPVEGILECRESITGEYLSKRKFIPVPAQRRKGNGKSILVKKAREHNLKNIDVRFPLGTFTVVSGVSGSGKSTLVNEILCKSLAQSLGRVRVRPGASDGVEGMEEIDKVIEIDQDPIGRTPRSNPATYTGVFDAIRDLFAMTPEAKARGYSKGRFSFNVKGGRCEACQGDGVKRISMNFLPDVFVPCDECHGKRYNDETLEVKYKGKSIYDVLEMTVEEGTEFFKPIPSIARKLQTLYDVGLGYIKLGQSATTLSGGEAQRVKLASELQKVSTGKTVYILDEPTTGLHSDDVKRLLEVLHRIVEHGDTVIVIEHNLDVIKNADYVIDLGPEGGDLGGNVIACGTPEEVARTKGSYTGEYLKKVLEVK